MGQPSASCPGLHPGPQTVHALTRRYRYYQHCHSSVPSTPQSESLHFPHVSCSVPGPLITWVTAPYFNFRPPLPLRSLPRSRETVFMSVLSQHLLAGLRLLAYLLLSLHCLQRALFIFIFCV